MSQNNHQGTLYNEFQKELNKYQLYLSKQYANIQSVFQIYFEEESQETPDLFFNLILADKQIFLENLSFSDPSFMIDSMKCMASGFTPNQVLYLALENPKRDQFIDLALTDEINFDNMYTLPSSTSVACLEKCMNHSLPLNNATQLIFNNHVDDKKDRESQITLVNFIIEKGANFQDTYNIPSYFPYETYESLLKQGLKASTLLNAALTITDADIRPQLIDLALNNKVDFDSMHSLPCSFTIAELAKFSEHGLTLNNAAKLIFNNHVDDKKDRESQITLVNFIIEKGANFQDTYNISSYFPYETYESLLKHGLKASALLNAALTITDAGIRA